MNIDFFPSKQQTKFDVCNVIRQMLIDNEAVNNLVQDNIFPIVAPEGTKSDFITYIRDEYSIDRTKMGIYSHQCTVFISCVSSSYDKSQLIADAVFQSLDGNYRINDNKQYISSINMVDSTEDYANDVYIQTLAFEIK